MTKAPSTRGTSIRLSTSSTCTSVSHKRLSNAKQRNSVNLHARRGHDRLERIETSKIFPQVNVNKGLDHVNFTGSTLTLPVSIASTGSTARRELWQERTPTSHDFPHIHPSTRRRPRPRSVIRAKSTDLRHGLSMTLYSYLTAAKAPFKASKRWRTRFSNPRVKITATLKKKEIQVRKRSMASVYISEPWSPGLAMIKQDTPRTASTSFAKTSAPSPLGCHPPLLGVPAQKVSPIKMRPRSTIAPPPIPKKGHTTRHRKRDSFNRAKLHVRRPPQGIAHWFDAYDMGSDDEDLVDTVESSSQKSRISFMSGSSTFHPSLGPNRLRAAPTSRLSFSTENTPDYFSCRDHNLRKHVAGTRSPPNGKRKSAFMNMGSLNLIEETSPQGTAGPDVSSDDDDIKTSHGSPKFWDLSTPSPGAIGQVFLKRAASHRKTSIGGLAARQSMSSARTNLTSATLPFMLRTGYEGAPGLPDSPGGTTPDFLPLSYYALTGRPPASSSADISLSSTYRTSGYRSAADVSSNRRKSSFSPVVPLSATSRMMVVTEEEMAFLEMMRRKRTATQQSKQAGDATTSVESDAVPAPLCPAKHRADAEIPEREVEVISRSRKSSAASTITLEDGQNLTFPNLPRSVQDESSRRASLASRASRNTSFDKGTLELFERSQWKVDSPLNETRTSASSNDAALEDIPALPIRSVKRPANLATYPTQSKVTLLRRSGNTGDKRLSQIYRDEEVLSMIPSMSFPELHLQPLTPFGSRTPPAQDEEAFGSSHELDNDHARYESSGSQSPGLTDGGNSSCGRQSRNEVETPSKACAFTTAAFDVVEGDDDDESQYASPLLGQANDMYAFAAKANAKTAMEQPGDRHVTGLGGQSWGDLRTYTTVR